VYLTDEDRAFIESVLTACESDERPYNLQLDAMVQDWATRLRGIRGDFEKRRPYAETFLNDPPNRLRELRLYAGLHQREIAERLPHRGSSFYGPRPIAASWISCWERGEKPIPDALRGPLAAIFDVPVDELMSAEPGQITIPEDW
jgi:hypothetical protein